MLERDEQAVNLAPTVAVMAGVGPGRRLQQARQRIGFEASDIAKLLYLTTEHILKLENDDYTNIVSLTFEKGYLRSYARLLSLPENEIIDAFNQLGIEEVQPVMPEGMYGRPITIKPRRYLRWASISVLIMVLATLLLWWQGQRTLVGAPISNVLPQLVETTTEQWSAPEDKATQPETDVVADTTATTEAQEEEPAPAAVAPEKQKSKTNYNYSM